MKTDYHFLLDDLKSLGFTSIGQACFFLGMMLLLAFHPISGLSQISIEVDNTVPRTDVKENIVDAHDGRIIKFEDTFYWYGTSYGNSNGFTPANDYVCYSSPDMKTWKKEGPLLADRPEGVYYRPHVIYNARTKKYVLWFNWYPKLWEGQFGVAVSKNPEGPFKIVNDHVKMARSEAGLGDFGLFVDDDAKAYISYNTIENHQVSIEKLNDDYTGSTMDNGGVIAQHMEAGSQFKRDGKYYLLTDYTCCFCNYGSGARVYVSNEPMKGYRLTGNINRYPGRPSYVLGDNTVTGTRYETLAKTDSVFNALMGITPEPIGLDALEMHIFTGNRPENCGDVDNPRVHPKIGIPEFEIAYWDFGEWRPIKVDSVRHEKSALKETLIYHFPSIRADRIKVLPKNKYPFEEIYVNEIRMLSTGGAHVSDAPMSETTQWYVTGGNIPQKPIIPAQQTYVMPLETATGTEYIWMGDLWGSASDNVKGHDYQYWSEPLKFKDDGTIKQMEWTDSWSIKVERP